MRSALLILFLLSTSFGGCITSDDGEGDAEFLAMTSQALSAADVTNVRVTVTGSGISPAITYDLTKSQGTWKGTIHSKN